MANFLQDENFTNLARQAMDQVFSNFLQILPKIEQYFTIPTATKPTRTVYAKCSKHYRLKEQRPADESIPQPAKLYK